MNTIDRYSQFRALTYDRQPENLNRKQNNKIKRIAAASSFIGMSVAFACIAKKQGLPYKFSELRKLPLNQWPAFKIAKKGAENQKLLNIEEKEIIALASGSVLGGLLGGAIADGKNMKAKFREAITQMAGNVLIPVAFVGGVSKIYNKYADKIKKAMPQINKSGSFVNGINKFVKTIPAVGMTFAALALGIFSGSKVTNLINEKFFGQKKHRDIKATDFAPHVDDLCLAITLMGSKNSPVASTITRTVPLFLSVPGYQVGKAK